MRNQSELALTEAQKTAIMAATREARDALDPIQWELHEKQQSLTALVSGPTIDEAALLAQADEVMTLEMQLKKQHLLLLVKIKNELTPEQQQKAKSLRGSGRRGGGFGGGQGGGQGGRARGGPPGGRP
jgi:Spy/CpxP family protein refolding chaperone